MNILKLNHKLLEGKLKQLIAKKYYYFASEAQKPLSYYYTVLNLRRGFTPQQLKSAYLEMVKKYHPDLSKQPDAAQKFREVQVAYDLLQDTQKVKKQEQRMNSYKQQEEENQEEDKPKQHRDLFKQMKQKRQYTDDSMKFSYSLYKKHYQKFQQKKKQYVKYPGHQRQQWAHKDQKKEDIWPTLGVGALMIGLISGAIYFVNLK